MVALRNVRPATAGVRGGSALDSGDGEGAGPYYANFGPARGPLIYNDALIAIRVTKRRGRAMIGMALCVGADGEGRAVWQLSIPRAELPGRWVVIDREFRRATSPGRA
jgi:hypothetical protein